MVFLWLFESHEKMQNVFPAVFDLIPLSSLYVQFSQRYGNIFRYIHSKIGYFLSNPVDFGVSLKILQRKTNTYIHPICDICVCVWLSPLYCFVYIQCVSILFISVFQPTGCNVRRSTHIYAWKIYRIYFCSMRIAHYSNVNKSISVNPSSSVPRRLQQQQQQFQSDELIREQCRDSIWLPHVCLAYSIHEKT